MSVTCSLSLIYFTNYTCSIMYICNYMWMIFADVRVLEIYKYKQCHSYQEQDMIF